MKRIDGKNITVSCTLTGRDFMICRCHRCAKVRGFPVGYPETDAEVDVFMEAADHLKYGTERDKARIWEKIKAKIDELDESVGKVYQYSKNIYILCETFNTKGKCTGPVLLDTAGMTKQGTINACLDLISKYGKQEVLTKLLNKLNKA